MSTETLPAPAAPPPAGDAAPRRRARRVAAAVVFGFALLLAAGAVPRLAARRVLASDVAAAAGAPAVAVVVAARAADTASFVLPGGIQARRQTAVYARTSGYVRRWLVDIGTPVAAGALLAEIEAPETDQELRQTRARLVRSQAGLALARSTFERYRGLAADSAVTQQEFDERRAAYEAAVAGVGEEAANVQRLVERRAFQRVTAPFAGTVTTRDAEVGAFVTAAGGGVGGTTGAAALFTLAQTDTVRIAISVPQSSATDVAPGMTTDVLVREFAGRTFRGRVARTASALDPATRTLRAEIEVPNLDRALLAGMYAQVRFTVRRAAPPVVVPATALLSGSGGSRVALVGADRRVRFRPVELGRDLGATVEVLRGVEAGATLVVNPPEQLTDGAAVDPRGAPNERRGPAAAARRPE